MIIKKKKKRFSVFKRSEERRNDFHSADKNVIEDLELLIDQYKKLDFHDLDKILFDGAMKICEGSGHTKKEIDTLVSLIYHRRYDPYSFKYGMLISAMINDTVGESDKINIDLGNTIPFYYIGYGMEKGQLTVSGRVGEGLGKLMNGGEIICKNKASSDVGFLMNKGKIYVHGNVANGLGNWMKGGKIIVKGNAATYAGYRMRGGEIMIHGNCEHCTGKDMLDGKMTILGDARGIVGERKCGGRIYVSKRNNTY